MNDKNVPSGNNRQNQAYQNYPQNLYHPNIHHLIPNLQFIAPMMGYNSMIDSNNNHFSMNHENAIHIYQGSEIQDSSSMAVEIVEQDSPQNSAVDDAFMKFMSNIASKSNIVSESKSSLVVHELTVKVPEISKGIKEEKINKPFQMDGNSLIGYKTDNSAKKPEITVNVEIKDIKSAGTLSSSKIEMLPKVSKFQEQVKKPINKPQERLANKPEEFQKVVVSVVPSSYHESKVKQQSDTNIIQNDDWMAVNSKKKKKPKSDNATKSQGKPSFNDSFSNKSSHSREVQIKPRSLSTQEIAESSQKSKIFGASYTGYDSSNKQKKSSERSRDTTYDAFRKENLAYKSRDQVTATNIPQNKKPVTEDSSVKIIKSEMVSTKREEKQNKTTSLEQKSKMISSPVTTHGSVKNPDSEQNTRKSAGLLPISCLSIKNYEDEEDDSIRFSEIGKILYDRICYTITEVLSLSQCKASMGQPGRILRMHLKLLRTPTTTYNDQNQHQWSGRRSNRTLNTTTTSLKTNCPWMNKKEQLKSMSQKEAKEEMIITFIRKSLNKLSETSFLSISKEILEGPLDQDLGMEKFTDQLHEKALRDTKCIHLYAKLARAIHQSRSSKLARTKEVFVKILSDKCCSLVRDSTVESSFDPSILKKNRNSVNIDALITVLYEKEVTYKMKYRGNVEFLSSLYLEQVLSHEAILKFIDVQLKVADEFATELLCRLLSLAGKHLEKKDKKIVDTCFNHFDKIKSKLPSKINYRVADLRELREQNWLTGREENVSRSSVEAQATPNWKLGSSGGRSNPTSSGQNTTSGSHRSLHSNDKNINHSSRSHSSSHSRPLAGKYDVLSSTSVLETSAAQKSSSGKVDSNKNIQQTPVVKKARFINTKLTTTTPDLVQTNIKSVTPNASAVATRVNTNSILIPLVPELPQDELEKMKLISQTLVQELSSHCEIEIADATIMSSDIQLHMYIFINIILDNFLEKNCGHLNVGNYLFHLLDTSLLKFSDLSKGLDMTMNCIQDLCIDVPSAFSRLILMLAPLICHKKLSLNYLYESMKDNYVEQPSKHIISALILIKDRLSMVDSISAWCYSKLDITTMEPQICLDYLKKNDLEFVLPTAAADKDSSFSKLKIQPSVHSLLCDDNVTSSQVFRQFQDPNYYAIDAPASYIFRSLFFNCPFGSVSLIRSNIKNMIKDNQQLFNWICENNRISLVSMLLEAHEFTHLNNHLPYGFISILAECLLSYFTDISQKDIEETCSTAKASCSVFQNDLFVGISAYLRVSSSLKTSNITSSSVDDSSNSVV